MRKTLPILLLAVFLLPLLAPLLAFGQGGESLLPACCRRAGLHHCAMTVAEKNQATATDTAPRWTPPADRCPYTPAAVAPGHLRETFAAPLAQASYAEIASHPAGAVQTESKRRIAENRSRQKRGPPSLLS